MKTIAACASLICLGISLLSGAPAQKTVPASPAAVVPAAPKPADSLKPAVKKDTLAPALQFGKLRIISRPDSAVVVLDSISKGETPLQLDSVSIGQHTVLVKKKGYFVKKITVIVTADTAQELNVVLVKPGCVVAKTDPPGARCFLDNTEVGVTPYENAKLKPGEYTLRFELLQRAAMERRVTVAEGVCDTVTITLPYSQAYMDSVAQVQKELDAKIKKAKRTDNLIVVGLFVLFGVAIVAIEAANAR